MAVCVVLGAGPGVGTSVAKAFLERDYHVALCARDRNKLAGTAAVLGERASTWQIDVSNYAALRKTLDDISSAHGELEVLVFNAFSLAAGKATGIDPEAFNSSMQVNITSALVATQAVIPSMLRNGKGSVLLTGGGFALQPFSDLAALSVGKAGLRVLAHCLHQELKSKGVHVGTVTICGTVQPGTEFDPDVIAKEFVRLHDQAKGAFEAEIIFSGRGQAAAVKQLSFPYKALVSFRLKETLTNEIKPLIPSEQARVAELRDQQIVTQFYQSKDKSRGWLCVQGEDEDSVRGHLKTLPMYEYLHLEFDELV